MYRRNDSSSPKKPRNNAPERLFRKMRNMHIMWHQKEPDKVFDRAHDLPKFYERFGRMEDIVYESDKWENDGDLFDYIHTFDSHPFIYGPAEQWDDIETTRLLGVPSLAEIPLVKLGTVKTIVVRLEDGEVEEFHFANDTLMCGTLDKKAVVVMDQRNPLVIRGGEMRITARGIVK